MKAVNEIYEFMGEKTRKRDRSVFGEKISIADQEPLI